VVEDYYILQDKFGAPELGQTGAREKPFAASESLKPLKDARDAFERDYLTQVLALTEGNVSQAAKLAGKYRADFYDLLKKHDLRADEFKKPKPGLTS
jgi:two-component system response regulator GlrR